MNIAKNENSELTPGQALRQRLLKKGIVQHKKDIAKMSKFFAKVLKDVDLTELRKKAWKTAWKTE